MEKNNEEQNEKPKEEPIEKPAEPEIYPSIYPKIQEPNDKLEVKIDVSEAPIEKPEVPFTTPTEKPIEAPVKRISKEPVSKEPIKKVSELPKPKNHKGYDVFLGCVIPARLPFLETSGRKIFERLGIPLNDVDGFSCCPDPTGVELISHKAWLALGARNLSLSSSKEGIISFCSGCVETLKGVNHAMKEKHAKKETNSILGKTTMSSYKGNTKVSHFAEVLYKQIKRVKQNVRKPLREFKVAVHYGCHYLRPSNIIKWDDPFKPKTVDAIVEALGAESVPYEYKMECCGNPVSKTDKDLSLLFVKKKLEAIQETGANCVVVVCPACYQQFDFNQRDLNKNYGTTFNFPIFYLSELVALAFGFTPDELGLKFHATKLKTFLEQVKI